MKKIFTTVILFFSSTLLMHATTYTYTSTNYSQSDWTLVSNWSPSYPGSTINSGDSVIVSGWVKVNVNVQMDGTMLATNYVRSFYDGITVLGNNSLIVGSTGTIYNEGHIKTFNTSRLEINGYVELSGNTADCLMLEDSSTVIIHPNGNLYIEDSIFVNYSSWLPATQCVLTVNGTITNDGIIYNLSNSVINGTGSIVTSSSTSNGIIVGSGSVAPGLSPGELKTDFDYALSSNGILDIEIGGIIAGTEYDVLGGTGNKTLDGTLNVSLYNNFIPTAGYTYTIVKGSSISDTFNAVNYPPLPNNMIWEIEYTSDEVILKVNAATAVSQSKLASNVKIYPNPSKGILQIDGLKNQEFSYAVYSVSGSILQSGKLNSPSLKLNTITNGFYELVLISAKGERIVKPFSVIEY